MSRAPSFVRGAEPPAHARKEWLVLALLALALVAQLFFSQRAHLAAHPQWRPWVEGACAVARCEVPAWREPSAFSMLARDVIARPDRPGLLRVQASFRNDARWAQAWPALVLTLADADGRTVGSRRFSPAEYLGQAPREALIAPGQATELAFDIVEPAPGVVAFDFRFD